MIPAIEIASFVRSTGNSPSYDSNFGLLYVIVAVKS